MGGDRWRKNGPSAIVLVPLLFHKVVRRKVWFDLQ